MTPLEAAEGKAQREIWRGDRALTQDQKNFLVALWRVLTLRGREVMGRLTDQDRAELREIARRLIARERVRKPKKVLPPSPLPPAEKRLVKRALAEENQNTH